MKLLKTFGVMYGREEPVKHEVWQDLDPRGDNVARWFEGCLFELQKIQEGEGRGDTTRVGRVEAGCGTCGSDVPRGVGR